jgi:hypothetical protein
MISMVKFVVRRFHYGGEEALKHTRSYFIVEKVPAKKEISSPQLFF